MTFDPMIITWDMLGFIGDYCGKIQLNSDKVRQELQYQNKMGLRYWLTQQRVEVLINRYQQHVNIADIDAILKDVSVTETIISCQNINLKTTIFSVL